MPEKNARNAPETPPTDEKLGKTCLRARLTGQNSPQKLGAETKAAYARANLQIESVEQRSGH